MSDKGYQEGTTDDPHFLNVQETWRKYMEEARINSALRSLSLVPDTRPICSADGCSERESCGSYCRDNGNFK